MAQRSGNGQKFVEFFIREESTVGRIYGIGRFFCRVWKSEGVTDDENWELREQNDVIQIGPT